MGMSGSINPVTQGITNLSNVAKGKGETVQATTPTTPTTAPNTGQWYDNPNWSQAYNNATRPQNTGYQTSYQYQNPYAMNNPIQPNYNFYTPRQYNAEPYMQQDYRAQMYQNPYAPEYTPQNGYQPYYRPPQNPYQGQFGGIK